MNDTPTHIMNPQVPKPRSDNEPPVVVATLGWQFHHVGIPTDTQREDEVYLEPWGLHVSGFSGNPYGVEWMRFEKNSPLPELIKKVPHLAFQVEDLDVALMGKEVIIPPGSPSDGVRTAMIVHDGVPIELIWFRTQSDQT